MLPEKKHPEVETLQGNLLFICKVFFLHQVWMAMGFKRDSVSKEGLWRPLPAELTSGILLLSSRLSLIRLPGAAEV